MQDLEELRRKNLLLSNFSYLNPIVSILDSIDRNSCPRNINLHCHTTFSDGSLDPIELIDKACELNLKHLAVTDHHSVSAVPIIYEWINRHSNLKNIPVFWTGVEISCLLSGCLVHIIGLGIDIESDYIYPYIQGEATQGNFLRAETVIESIRRAKGISILAHPARYRLDYNFIIEKAYMIGISGIEVWYDYENSTQWKYSDLICKSIDKKTNEYQLLKSCGTDTHGYSLLGR